LKSAEFDLYDGTLGRVAMLGRLALIFSVVASGACPQRLHLVRSDMGRWVAVAEILQVGSVLVPDAGPCGAPGNGLYDWRPRARWYIRRKMQEFFMRVFRLAAVITFLASPAFAQVPPVNLLQDNKPPKSQEEKDAEAARDKAYKDSLKKIPDAKAPTDPWGNVRSTDTSAPKAAGKSASTAKPKAKAGSSAN
jgi:hypothetical protein